MLSLEQRRAARKAFSQRVRQEDSQRQSEAVTIAPPLAQQRAAGNPHGPVRVAIVTPVLYVGGAEQWIASLCHWLDPDRAIVTKVIVLFPNAINDVAVSWLPRWVEVVDSRKIEQDGSFDVVITWGLLDFFDRISHLTCPTIDVQHGVFMHETWQSPLVKAATRAHELFETTIVGVNEAVRSNFPEHVRDQVKIIPNGSDPGRVYPLIDRNELKASLGLTPENKVVVYIGRIAVEKNVQALVDAMEHFDDSWHAVIIGPQYVPLERIGPIVHLLPAQRRIGNWLGIDRLTACRSVSSTASSQSSTGLGVPYRRVRRRSLNRALPPWSSSSLPAPVRTAIAQPSQIPKNRKSTLTYGLRGVTQACRKDTSNCFSINAA
jgi:hypothetical protein